MPSAVYRRPSFDQQALGIIAQRKAIFAQDPSTVQTVLSIARQIAEDENSVHALYSLRHAKNLRELRSIQQKLGSRFDADGCGRPLAESKMTGTRCDTGSRTMVTSRKNQIVTAILDELHQYREDERYDVKQLILSAIELDETNPDGQKKVIKALIGAWGINDLRFRLNVLNGQTNDGFEFIPVGADLTGYELEFLKNSLGLDVDRINVEDLSEKLDALIAVSPDKDRAKFYAELLRDRFVQQGKKRSIRNMASERGIRPAAIVKKINEATFLLDDLARWIDFGADEVKIIPIPARSIRAVMETVTGKMVNVSTDIAALEAIPEMDYRFGKGDLAIGTKKRKGSDALQDMVDILSLRIRTDEDREQLTKVLRTLRANGVWKKIRDADPICNPLRVLELRYLDGNGRSCADVAVQLLAERRFPKRVTATWVGHLQKQGLILLKTAIGTGN